MSFKSKMKWLLGDLIFKVRRDVHNASRVSKKVKSAGFSETTLYFDSSTICTANCIFCAYQYDNRPKEVASIGLFKKAIDEFTMYGGHKLNLTPLTGEVFVSNDVIEMIEYASKHSIDDISFYTNATLLHKVDMEKLVSLPIRRIGLSIPPLDAVFYKSIYRSDSFKRVISNIEALLKSAKKCHSKINISIEHRGHLTLSECMDLPAFKKYCKPHLTSKVQVNAIKNGFDTWGGRISQDDLIEGMNTIKRKINSPSLPCSRLWNIHIEPNGNVNLCGCRTSYNSIASPLYLGNITEDSIYALYNSKKAQEIRRSFITGSINELCKNCSWYAL